MLIAVGTENNPKLEAVRRAARIVYPGQDITVVGSSETSGVSDHPASPSEARNGALNRVWQTQERYPKADLFVGIEGGLELEQVYGQLGGVLRWHDRWSEYGFVVAIDTYGVYAWGRSCGLAIPDHLMPIILEGGDLNQAIEQAYGIPRIGDRGGATQLLTGGALNRVSAYVPGIIQTLSQLKHKNYYQAPA